VTVPTEIRERRIRVSNRDTGDRSVAAGNRPAFQDSLVCG